MTRVDGPTVAADPQAVEEFAGRIVADAAATTTTALATLGDRLGLWRALADGERMTGAELAARTGVVVERYAHEWCNAMAAAGYLRYEPETRRFALPPEHAAVLADECEATFLGGLKQLDVFSHRPASPSCGLYRRLPRLGPPAGHPYKPTQRPP